MKGKGKETMTLKPIRIIATDCSLDHLNLQNVIATVINIDVKLFIASIFKSRSFNRIKLLFSTFYHQYNVEVDI